MTLEVLRKLVEKTKNLPADTPVTLLAPISWSDDYEPTVMDHFNMSSTPQVTGMDEDEDLVTFEGEGIDAEDIVGFTMEIELFIDVDQFIETFSE